MSQPFCFDCGLTFKKEFKHVMRKLCRFWDPLELFLIDPWNVPFTYTLDFFGDVFMDSHKVFVFWWYHLFGKLMSL